MKMDIKNKNVIEFTLTDKEVEDTSFLTMDDASLGKQVKATALILAHDQLSRAGTSASLTGTAIAILLANVANQSNAGNMTLDLKGVTFKGKDVGDFKITVEKLG